MKTVTITTASTLVANPNCPFAHIKVTAASAGGPVYFCYDGGTAATVADGMPVDVGEYVNTNDNGSRQVFKNAVYAIVSSGTATLKVQGDT